MYVLGGEDTAVGGVESMAAVPDTDTPSEPLLLLLKHSMSEGSEELSSCQLEIGCIKTASVKKVLILVVTKILLFENIDITKCYILTYIAVTICS